VSEAYCLHRATIGLQAAELGDEQLSAELGKFTEAREKALAELREIHSRVAAQVGRSEAAVFGSHAAILGDESFSNQVARYILEKRQTAEAALESVLGDYAPVFAAIKSEYLKERMADLRDIVGRLQKHLLDAPDMHLEQISGVLVVDDLLPSDLIPLDNQDIVGVLTQTGGQTGHAAILARSRGIPAVSGIDGLLDRVKTGEIVIVDGHEGIAFVGPDHETERAYRKHQREYVRLKDELVANRDQPAVSADGQPAELLANVNSLADAHAAASAGASGIGLFRTEYLFLAHPDVPDEDEQAETYRAVIGASPGRVVTIRSLDIGGDKILPYLGDTREINPFMGWRSIRLAFEYPDFFIRQIRAILRAAAEVRKKVQMLFPMITTRDEVLRVRRMVAQAQRQLEKENASYGRVRLGVMIEVPVAALSINSFLDIVDYVSIGSNDLVQYLAAADRDNPKVNHLCQPLNPAVLKVLADVIDACRLAGKPVTLCGEMAGSLRAFPLLFGMGLRSYSMSPAFIPTIKQLMSQLTEEHAGSLLKRALGMKTARQVIRFMDRELAQTCPGLELLETAY
jgi:phosphotransferase system enzyme I (PtsI)